MHFTSDKESYTLVQSTLKFTATVLRQYIATTCCGAIGDGAILVKHPAVTNDVVITVKQNCSYCMAIKKANPPRSRHENPL